jgi:AraC-like DNA-binding protein
MKRETVIKTYYEPDREKHLSFRISKMEDAFDLNGGKADDPHRHDFYTVLLIEKGKGQHLVDFNTYDVAKQQVYFIHPGQVHQLAEDERSYGYSILFSTDFLIQNSIPIAFIQDLNLFHDYGSSPPLLLQAEGLARLKAYAQEMMEQQRLELKFKSEAIGSLLRLFLIECNRICALPSNTQTHEAGNSVLKQFKQLVEEHYLEWHHTSSYASKLHITPDHLNRTVKQLIGKTAKEYIQSRITIEAKRLLYFSDYSAKEIGYQLGFTEPAHFSTFFKNCTKLSPSSFRKQS